MMKAIYPGSFDPITLGHMDLIRRASMIADELIVAVMVNPDKTALFSGEERLKLIREACAGVPGVYVITFGGLLAHLAREKDCRLIIRGVRTASDLESELTMAQANAQLLPGLETLLLPASPSVSSISSSLVRQIAVLGGDVTPFVPIGTAEALRKRFYT
jgi:pantetheine-phosphate adenylyltransferase